MLKDFLVCAAVLRKGAPYDRGSFVVTMSPATALDREVCLVSLLREKPCPSLGMPLEKEGQKFGSEGRQQQGGEH